MTPDTANDRDPLAGYAAGDRAAVNAARPDEPTDAQWDAVRRRIADRLTAVPRPRRVAVWVAAAGVALATAAAILWFAFAPPAVEKREMVKTPPAPAEQPDPLAEFAVLPMASAEEVEFRRMPGTGWFPGGEDPLPPVLMLATTAEVQLDDPDSVWPQVTPSPGDAPMIYAAKPR